jgi:hypothetical protein
MNEKKAKRIRKAVQKESDKVITGYLNSVKTLNFLNRLDFA